MAINDFFLCLLLLLPSLPLLSSLPPTLPSITGTPPSSFDLPPLPSFPINQAALPPNLASFANVLDAAELFDDPPLLMVSADTADFAASDGIVVEVSSCIGGREESLVVGVVMDELEGAPVEGVEVGLEDWVEEEAAAARGRQERFEEWVAMEKAEDAMGNNWVEGELDGKEDDRRVSTVGGIEETAMDFVIEDEDEEEVGFRGRKFLEGF